MSVTGGSGPIALSLMCKAPVEGACKTRLCPPLTAAEAAEISRRFIADVAQVIADVATDTGSQGVAVFTPPEDGAAFDALLPEGFARLAQRGTGLSERLLHSTRDLLGQGAAGICLINADSPTLPAAPLRQAVAALCRPGDRVVIGPAIDGGYYLIGLKALHPELFRGIAWSTSRVLAETLSRAAGRGLPVTLLPLWYDVDELGALQLLLHELFGAAPLALGGLTGSAAAQSRAYLETLLHAPNADRFGLPEMGADW